MQIGITLSPLTHQKKNVNNTLFDKYTNNQSVEIINQLTATSPIEIFLRNSEGKLQSLLVPHDTVYLIVENNELLACNVNVVVNEEKLKVDIHNILNARNKDNDEMRDDELHFYRWRTSRGEINMSDYYLFEDVPTLVKVADLDKTNQTSFTPNIMVIDRLNNAVYVQNHFLMEIMQDVRMEGAFDYLITEFLKVKLSKKFE